MSKTVSEVFVETLIAAGVKCVYGVVGDSLNGLTDVIRKSGKIEWLHVQHEEVAAFAAGADAHLTGELAVCSGSCGPGTFTSSMVCLTVIGIEFPFLRSPHRYQATKLEGGIFDTISDSRRIGFSH